MLLPREAELATQFDVSRQAVREALKVLGAKGLVQSRRRTGTRVSPRTAWNLLDPDVLAWHPHFEPKMFADLGELRRLIEPSAAELAARRGSREGVAAIGEALSRMRAAIDTPDAFREADADFHQAVFTASGNEFISRLSGILLPLLRASFRMQDDARGVPIVDKIIVGHQAVFDAVTAGDGVEARQQMEVILSDYEEEVSQLFPLRDRSAR